MPRKRFTKEEEKQVGLEYQKGSTSVQLGKKYKTHFDTILKAVRASGFKVRSRSEIAMKQRIFSDPQEEKIAAEYIDGFNTYSLGRKYGVDRTVIRNLLKRQNVQARHRKYSVNEAYFAGELDAERAYWLGFIIADGCVDKRNVLHIGLQIGDIQHLYKFRECIESENPIYFRKRKNRKYCCISICSKPLVESLLRYEIFPRKTHRYSFPEIPKNLLSHYIRGYIDGDGSLGRYKQKRSRTHYICCSASGSEKFIMKMRIHLSSELRISLGSLYFKKKTLSVRWQRKQYVLSILDYCYGNAQIYLDRKYKKAMQILDRYPLQYSFLTSLP